MFQLSQGVQKSKSEIYLSSKAILKIANFDEEVRRFLYTLSSEEDVDSLPSNDTSESNDDYSEREKEHISTQEDKTSLSVSEKIDISMPLID